MQQEGQLTYKKKEKKKSSELCAVCFSEAEKLEGSSQQVKWSLKGKNSYLKLAVPLEY